MTPARRLISVFTLVALLGVLSACYVPARFDAEVTIDRRGYYELIFDGYMADTDLFRGLKNGEISALEEREKVETIKRDFLRDPNTTEFEYYKQAHFKVHWEREGDITADKYVTFLRRNNNVLSIKYLAEQGVITILGTAISDANAERLANLGLGMVGQIRVITDAKVASSNHDRTYAFEQDPSKTVYVWEVAGFEGKAPQMQLALR